MIKKGLALLFLCLLSTSTCFSQVDVSVSLGFSKNNASFNHTYFQGPKGRLTSNTTEVVDPIPSFQLAIPVTEKLKLQGGLRVMLKHYYSNLQFNYPGNFQFEYWWVNYGLAVELPLLLIYELPNPVLGRTIKIIAGGSLSRNTINKVSENYGTEIFAPAPNTLGFSIETETIHRKTFLTPALEAGLEFSPLFFNNFGVRAIYHYDLIPSFKSTTTYKYSFSFNPFGPLIQDFPQGTITAKRTSYISVQLNYRLPFWNKKKKAAYAAPEIDTDFEDDGSE